MDVGRALQVLGMAQVGDQETVRRAYLDAARACHPDKNPGDADAADKFKAVTEAYTVLSELASTGGNTGGAGGGLADPGGINIGGFVLHPFHSKPRTVHELDFADVRTGKGGVGCPLSHGGGVWCICCRLAV